MSATAGALLADARRRGCEIDLHPGTDRVKLKVPPESGLTWIELERLRQAKAEIRELLRQERLRSNDRPPLVDGDRRWPTDWQQEYRRKQHLQLVHGFSLTPEQAAWVAYHETVALARALGEELDTSVAPPAPATWPPMYQRYAEEILARRVPSGPVKLRSGIQIVDPARWLDSLRRDWAAGPRGPRGRYGALFCDIQDLDWMTSDQRDSYEDPGGDGAGGQPAGRKHPRAR